MLKFSKIFENYRWALRTRTIATIVNKRFGSHTATAGRISSWLANVIANRDNKI